MHGLVAASGSAARHLTRDTIVHHLGASAADGIHHFVDDPGVSVAFLVPPGGLLAKVGLAAADHLQSKLEDIEHGRERSAGELAHLTAFAHLLTARPVLRPAGPSWSVTTL